MEAGDNRYAMNADRRILNPLYSDNRLKLGYSGQCQQRLRRDDGAGASQNDLAEQP